MTVSLCVIMIECTNEISFALPIMMTLLISKSVGDLFNVGIYDMHIEIKHVPLLEWEPPAHGSDIKLKELLKNQNPVNLRKIMTVREIVRILKMTRHNGFPVTFRGPNEEEPPVLLGFILRSTLTAILHDGVVDSPDFDSLNRFYPRFPSIYELKLTEEYLETTLNLEHFMDSSP